ncbi:MAG: FixH family protein [Pseudomonadota bacterium]
MSKQTKPLTGRKVLMIAVGAFGAIITANLTLAYSAVQSFPGIEVKNGYIASQHFEADRAAQERLGWVTEARYEDGVLTVAVLDAAGHPAPIDDVAFRLGRPTTEADDLEPQLMADGRGWHAALDLAPGPWRLDIVGAAADETKFRQHVGFTIRAGG